jgi:hypothetical protein
MDDESMYLGLLFGPDAPDEFDRRPAVGEASTTRSAEAALDSIEPAPTSRPKHLPSSLFNGL